MPGVAGAALATCAPATLPTVNPTARTPVATASMSFMVLHPDAVEPTASSARWHLSLSHFLLKDNTFGLTGTDENTPGPRRTGGVS